MDRFEYSPLAREAVATLEHVARDFAPAVLVTAFGPESMVMIDLIAKHDLQIKILSIDTGRLPEATQDLIQRVHETYNLPIRLLHPGHEELDAWIREHGPNGFFESVDKRISCCHVRKVVPLKRALDGCKAWITGLRRRQGATRRGTQHMQWDPEYGLHKCSPLFEWTDENVWAYIRTYQVPYNALHDEDYPSIGCAPCTRAIRPGEDARAGRWWWERETAKECGLHFNPRNGRLERV